MTPVAPEAYRSERRSGRPVKQITARLPVPPTPTAGVTIPYRTFCYRAELPA